MMNKKIIIKISRPGLQEGLSLIELMIAMVIGLFLLLSISSVYLSNLKANNARDQYSLLEDNARLALDTMSNIIEHTGYQGRLIMTGEKFITNAPVEVPANACVTNNALFNNFSNTKDDDTGTAFTGDQIGIVYLGTVAPPLAGALPFDTDCSGIPAVNNCLVDPLNPVNATSQSRIFNAFYLSNTGKLMCVGSVGAGEQLIADNIENLQITYGLNSDGDPQGTVDQYVNAANMANRWGTVVSVQIAVLVRSDKAVKEVAEQKTYTLLDKQITAPQGAGNKDRFQRAVFSTTISLRNI